MKLLKQMLAGLICTFLPFFTNAQSNTKPIIAVLNIDSKGLAYDGASMGNLVRIELDKTGVYTVLDKYEVAEVLSKNKVDLTTCFSKSCLIQTGKMLNAQKMLGGSIELLDEKIVITLKLIDVETGTVEKSNVTEYLNLPEIQKMVRVSIQRIVGIEPDITMVNQLIDYDVPIQSPKNALRLNGPRMGFATTFGDAAEVITNKTVNGGFNMFPVTFEFGWQQEFQYISAGNFQALVENVFLISGLESGRVIPNYAALLGFRFGKKAWEFGFGPTLKVLKKADGYFDANNNWHLENDWNNGDNKYPIVSRLDSRGNPQLSTGLVIAVGRTFHSGYLNIPLNVYVAPSRDGTNVGATFGFNIQKKDLNKKKNNSAATE
jgi:hypothetical protein